MFSSHFIICISCFEAPLTNANSPTHLDYLKFTSFTLPVDNTEILKLPLNTLSTKISLFFVPEYLNSAYKCSFEHYIPQSKNCRATNKIFEQIFVKNAMIIHNTYTTFQFNTVITFKDI